MPNFTSTHSLSDSALLMSIIQNNITNITKLEFTIELRDEHICTTAFCTHWIEGFFQPVGTECYFHMGPAGKDKSMCVVEKSRFAKKLRPDWLMQLSQKSANQLLSCGAITLRILTEYLKTDNEMKLSEKLQRSFKISVCTDPGRGVKNNNALK